MKMKSLRDIKISAKLMLLGLVSILGLFLLGSESVSTAWRINQVGAELNDIWMNAVIVAEELNTTTSDYRIRESRHAITTDPELMASLEAELEVLEKNIENKFSQYQKLPTQEADQAIIREAQVVWNEYLECSRNLVETSKGNDREQATELMMGESQELFNRASGLFLQAVDYTKQATAAEREQASLLYHRLSHIKLLVIAGVSLVVIVLILSLIRSIKKPSEALADAARRATNGNLDIQLDYHSEDEIGILTEAMNLLIQRLKDIINDETRMFREIASRNFNVKSNCEQAYRGDFAPILYAFTSLQSCLKEMKRQQEEEVAKLKAQITELEKRIEEYEQK